MSFYNTLSKYYDEIFPLNQDTLNMLEKNLKEKKKLLDIACGSGTYSIELEKLGHKLTAIDLDETMIEKAKEKSNKSIEYKTMNMLDIDKINKKFDGVFCIGNSLVHLDNIKEIEDFFEKVYNLLNDEGIFIFQIINYDRVIKNNVKSLPTIEKEKQGIIFERNYYTKDGKIDFKGIITVHNNEKFENIVSLYPLMKNEIECIIEKVGFKYHKFFGSFKEEELNNNSMAMVTVAYK